MKKKSTREMYEDEKRDKGAVPPAGDGDTHNMSDDEDGNGNDREKLVEAGKKVRRAMEASIRRRRR
jgi:hypothetical protein